MVFSRPLYTFLLRLLTPLLIARLAWRGAKAPAYFRHWPERFGFSGLWPQSKSVLWLHAVSVGEVLAARPLVERLKRQFPEHGWMITVTTPTGRERAEAAFGAFATVRYLPYDLPGANRRFLAHFQPVMAVVMETEFWPNLFAEIRARGIPLVLANVRMSERSAAGYARFATLTRDMLSCVTWAAVQTEDDGRRMVELGLNATRMAVTGSVKVDAPIAPEAIAAGRDLRRLLGVDRPLWIAASTRSGEEAIVLEAHNEVLKKIPAAGLLLVPRHPERFDEVAQLATQMGFLVHRRSGPSAPAAQWQVYLGDTMGELTTLYGAADVAFVGGSLVPLGGQNVLEPAAIGLPVLSGPHTFNFALVADELARAGGLVRVANAADLASHVVHLLSSAPDRQAQGQRARDYVTANQGAADKVVNGIVEVLRGQEPRKDSAPTTTA